jgi:hypothetical protein
MLICIIIERVCAMYKTLCLSERFSPRTISSTIEMGTCVPSDCSDSTSRAENRWIYLTTHFKSFCKPNPLDMTASQHSPHGAPQPGNPNAAANLAKAEAALRRLRGGAVRCLLSPRSSSPADGAFAPWLPREWCRRMTGGPTWTGRRRTPPVHMSFVCVCVCVCARARARVRLRVCACVRVRMCGMQ